MKWTRCEASALVMLIAFLVSALPLIAQDTPVTPTGTQVATEQTPAAAEDAEALRKAAQNPIASLVSVRCKTTTFGVDPDTAFRHLELQLLFPWLLTSSDLISRIITPIIFQPTTSQPTDQGVYGSET